MPQKLEDARLRRWQNNVSSEVALYSSPEAASCTEKLMVVSCDATPSSSNNRVSSG